MATPVKVKKWGSSMAVLIPSQFAKTRQIDVGSVLDLEAIRIIKPRRRYKLSELMPNSNPNTAMGSGILGVRWGREIW